MDAHIYKLSTIIAAVRNLRVLHQGQMEILLRSKHEIIDSRLSTVTMD